MVILGGRAKICVNENGRERVLTVRGGLWWHDVLSLNK